MYHIVIVVGNLGRDPEMRYTGSGQAVCSFSVATNRQYNSSSGEPVKETIWFRVSAWGKLAETCNQYLRKGSRVLVEARLTPDPVTGGPRQYQAQDGQWKANYDITAQTVRFLSSQGEQVEAGAAMAQQATASDEGEVPF